MSGPAGEMPFLDHLEELRTRILRSLAAVVLAFVVGFWVVDHFQLVVLIKEPIAPFLNGGKLAVLSPTEPVMIVLKLSLIVGLVLASPVIIWQVWAFVAPALYEREKKAIVPAIFIGSALFVTGAVLAYLYVLPQALRVLFSFQSEALAPVITYDAYFSFLAQIVLGLGLSFELPLVITIMAWLGIVSVGGLNRFRRYFLVLACVAGALLSPGTDVLSMLMMTFPLLLLYEVGVVATAIIERRRKSAAISAGLFLLAVLAGMPGNLAAQQPGRGMVPLRPITPAADSVADSLRRAANQRQQSLDSASARRLGLPTAPSLTFPAADSLLETLMNRPGYSSIRYMADSATLFAPEQRMELMGNAMTQRGKSILQADSIAYDEPACLLEASGDPQLFDAEQIVIGQTLRYNTCVRRAVVSDALTNFKEGGTVWFLRGSVAQDSSAKRIYASSGQFTSCDLPVPHYHFGVREVKWISQTVVVARPAVLYVRDVPVAWLPFIVQDARPGRHSGILIPQFGINDIIRPNADYSRQVTNIGYYWAPNEYFDATFRLDWYSKRYTQVGVATQYKWLSRFISGAVAVSRQMQSGGGVSNRILWQHRQQFNLTTSINLDIDYANNTQIINNNAVDPTLNTQLITSGINFSKRYRWGTFTVGANRRQSLTDGSGNMQLPSIAFTPKPIDFGRTFTWSPSGTFSNQTTFGTVLAPLLVTTPIPGVVDTVDQTGSSRSTLVSIATPLRIGSFNWQNSVSYADNSFTRREQVQVKVPDESTPDPTDSITVVRVYDGSFDSKLDWTTSFNLPLVLRRSWKVQPSVGVANVASGPFLVRNRETGGAWVSQTKRFAFQLSANPSFFGFYPGFAGFSRIRHTFAPQLSYNYSPAASVSEEYARAIALPGQALTLNYPALQVASFTMSNVIEGKVKRAKTDTLTEETQLRKVRLLSVTTSPLLAYDFELAKQPGHQGWTNQTMTNAFQSDLLRGLTLTITHNLWQGRADSAGAKFDPFLQSVSTGFGLSSRTFQGLFHLIGLGKAPPAGEDEPRRGTSSVPQTLSPAGRQSAMYNTFSSQMPTGQKFTAQINYTLSRFRPNAEGTTAPSSSNLSLTTSFSPTAFWTVSWSTQYSFTKGSFEAQTVRMERALHEWRASFNFVSNPNGNFSFYFQISLTDLPELKLDYNQTSIIPP